MTKKNNVTATTQELPQMTKNNVTATTQELPQTVCTMTTHILKNLF